MRHDSKQRGRYQHLTVREYRQLLREVRESTKVLEDDAKWVTAIVTRIKTTPIPSNTSRTSSTPSTFKNWYSLLPPSIRGY